MFDAASGWLQLMLTHRVIDEAEYRAECALLDSALEGMAHAHAFGGQVARVLRSLMDRVRGCCEGETADLLEEVQRWMDENGLGGVA